MGSLNHVANLPVAGSMDRMANRVTSKSKSTKRSATTRCESEDTRRTVSQATRTSSSSRAIMWPLPEVDTSGLIMHGKPSSPTASSSSSTELAKRYAETGSPIFSATSRTHWRSCVMAQARAEGTTMASLCASISSKASTATVSTSGTTKCGRISCASCRMRPVSLISAT